MKTGVIILARANFGRWPDKVLFQLQGKSILEHVIRKAKTLNVDTVIVSTTENQEDQIIRDIAWEPEVRNRYLFDCNIAFKIQTDNHRRICEHLGHFPENYEEVTKALLTIE